MRKVTSFWVCLILLFCSVPVWANPVPAPTDYLFVMYWYIKTAPINYAFDLVALCLAMLITRQIQPANWKLLPIYTIMTFIAGYIADGIGMFAADYYPASYFTRNEPIIGGITEYDQLMSNHQAVALMVAAALIIFALNWIIISLIIRWNEGDSYKLAPLGAGLIAVITSPYFGIKHNALIAKLIPLIMFVLCFCAWMLVRELIKMIHARRSAET